MIYVDLECPGENGNRHRNIQFTYQRVFSLAHYVCYSYDSLCKYRFRRDNDCVVWFIEELKNLMHNVEFILSTNVSMASEMIGKNLTALRTVMYAKNRLRRIICGNVIIAIWPNDTEAPRIQIVIWITKMIHIAFP